MSASQPRSANERSEFPNTSSPNLGSARRMPFRWDAKRWAEAHNVAMAQTTVPAYALALIAQMLDEIRQGLTGAEQILVGVDPDRRLTRDDVTEFVSRCAPGASRLAVHDE